MGKPIHRENLFISLCRRDVKRSLTSEGSKVLRFYKAFSLDLLRPRSPPRLLPEDRGGD